MSSNANTQVSLAKVAEYVETLTKDPQSRVFVPLSEIYRNAGMVEEAQSVVLKGIKQNPDYSLGYVALGRILVAQNLPDKAEKAFRKALQLDSESLPALKGLLRILWNKGDAEGARKTAEAVIGLKPGDADAEKILQLLAARADKESRAEIPREREAEAVVETAAKAKKAEGEEPIKTATLADIYVRQGLYEKALNLYRQILVSNPGNEEIQRKAQAVQKRLEDQKAEAAQSAATGVESDAVDFEETAPGDPEGEVGESPLDPTEATIRTLESWLDSIRQRREHVQ